MDMYTLSDLRQMQSLSLSSKIQMTRRRIKAWIDEFSEDGVYVSFSGGKDSTVLLDIVRKDYPGVKAVFVDTGLEYPEIRDFVRLFDNVEWIRTKKNFKQVIDEYGYPFISKEVSRHVSDARKYLKKLHEQKSKFLKEPVSYKILMGTFQHKQNGIPTGEYSKMYNRSKYKFFLDAPFEISSKCCDVMKKAPVHEYERKTGRKPITAQMACESRLRTKNWLENGCNGFDMKSPISNPMAFWTEQDVLQYIYINKLDIASVYGEVVIDYEADGQVEGQLSLADYGICDSVPALKTTRCKRTGCMFCGYGCHLEKSPNRFEQMKETHPKQYDYIMRSSAEGGLNYKEVIDWINENGNINIRY